MRTCAASNRWWAENNATTNHDVRGERGKLVRKFRLSRENSTPRPDSAANFASLPLIESIVKKKQKEKINDINIFFYRFLAKTFIILRVKFFFFFHLDALPNIKIR